MPSNKPVEGTVRVAIESVTVTKDVTVAPGKSEVKLAPAEFAQLTLQHPRLWWPNGYGKPELYTAKVEFSEGGAASDAKQVRFGVREVTYELGLLDSKGQLRRVEVSPTAARARGEQVVNVTHEGIRQIPAPDAFPEMLPKEWKDYWLAWAASLTPAGETSPAVMPANDPAMQHYLVLKVNGVRIAARGGSWGMDDSRKRVSREKLEPYFRLHREVERQHHPQLDGAEHGGDVLRAGRRVRHDGVERLLDDDAGLQHRAAGYSAVSRQHARHGVAVPQPSVDRDVVRTE